MCGLGPNRRNRLPSLNTCITEPYAQLRACVVCRFSIRRIRGPSSRVTSRRCRPFARALQDVAWTAPLDVRVRDQIVAETRGNPLALLELPRDLTDHELPADSGCPVR